MNIEKLSQDINDLIKIHSILEEAWDSEDYEPDEWACETIYRITGDEQAANTWGEDDLKYFIGGMQRALHLLEVYDED